MAGLSFGQFPQFDRLLTECYRSLITQIRDELARSENQQYRAMATWLSELGAHSAAAVLAELSSPPLNRQVAELRHIVSARRRIEQGTYGVCEACGAAIEVSWLRSHPTALRCSCCEKRRGPTHS